MAIEIDGNAMPSGMEGRGTYKFEPPTILRTNGEGEAVTAGFSRVEWRWRSLTTTEWDWINTTVLSGAASRLCTGTTKFWDHDGDLTTYSRCVVMRPQHGGVFGNRYRDVVLMVEGIE